MAENKSLFLWNGRSYSAAEFVDLQGVPEYVVAVQSALKFCISQATEWTLETSGSTGSPKAIALTRAMIYGWPVLRWTGLNWFLVLLRHWFYQQNILAA